MPLETREAKKKYKRLANLKRERKNLAIDVKLEVIRRIDEGQRNKEIADELQLSASTIRTIYLNREKIKRLAASMHNGALSNSSISRPPLFLELEKRLIEWIDNQSQSVGFIDIKKKAVSIFDNLKKKAIADGDKSVKRFTFKASNGWYERFKKRGFRKNTDKNSKITNRFPNEFAKIIKQGGYHPKQIFNVARTGLFWKRLSCCTLLTENESNSGDCHRASKDRLTLLLGGNLSGDVKLKPLVVYHSQNPKSLRGFNKKHLPVIWRSNKKASATQYVFFDYVQNYFCTLVEKYCRDNGLPNKALLIIDKALGHSSSEVDYGENVRVVLLPQDMPSSFQPMDQEIISIFKAYYVQLIMKYFVDGLQTPYTTSVENLWELYNIKMAIENIGTAWEKLSPKMLNASWKNLLSNYVEDFDSLKTIKEKILAQIVKFANKAGFDSVDVESVEQALNSHDEELTDQELIYLNRYGLDEDDRPEELPNEMDPTALLRYFALIDNCEAFLDQNDGNLERVRQVKTKINKIVQCYRDLYERKVQEENIAGALSVSSPSESVTYMDVQPSTSYEPILEVSLHKLIKEEVLDITDDSLMSEYSDNSNS